MKNGMNTCLGQVPCIPFLSILLSSVAPLSAHSTDVDRGSEQVGETGAHRVAVRPE